MQLASLRRPHAILQRVEIEPEDSLVCHPCSSDPAVVPYTFDSGYHFHPEHELIVIESGHGRRYVADSVEDFGPGDCALIGSNVPHVWRRHPVAPNGDAIVTNCIVLFFRPDCLGTEFWNRPELRRGKAMLARADRGLIFPASTARWVSDQLHELLEGKGIPRVLRFLQIIDRLSAIAARPLLTQSSVVDPVRQDVDRIDRIIEFLERNFGREIRLADAARVVSLSEASFCRFFTRATGKTFIRFLNELRLSHARQCLAYTDKPVLEICFDSGFSSLSNFNRRFHELVGESPRTYRNRMRQQLGTAERRISDWMKAP